jgi:autotransporter-associated beta strand protein
MTLGGGFDLGGQTRTITVGGYTNVLSGANGILTAGKESLRFMPISTTIGPSNTVANGTIRLVRDTAGADGSDFVAVNFGAGNTIFAANAGMTVGKGVITTLATSYAFGNASNSLPQVNVESGGYFNLSDGVNARTPFIRGLSGDGVVTALAVVAGTNSRTSLLTLHNQLGDQTVFSGAIQDGANSQLASLVPGVNNIMALTKSGLGTQVLSGSNAYTGATTVSAGLLEVRNTGSIQSSTNTVVNSSGTLLMNGTGGRAVVNSGGTLMGSGTMGDVVLNGGTLAPGNSPGLLTAASLDASSSGKFFFEIGAPTSRGITYDAINVSGLLTLSSSTVFDFSAWNSYAFQVSDTYDLLDWGNANFGSGATAFNSSTLLTSLNQDLALGAGMQWDVSSFTTDGKITVAVPEPSSGALLFMGFAMLMGIRALRRP